VGEKIQRSADKRAREPYDDRNQGNAETVSPVRGRKSHLKKNDKYLHAGVKDKVKLIKELSAKHDVKLLCRVFGVPRSTYYAALKRPPSKRELYNRSLKIRLLELYNASGGRYGCIKLHRLLIAENWAVSQFKVLRLMRELKIRSVVVRKYRHSKQTSDNVPRENIVDRNFKADAPNKVWLSDITYIYTIKNGWTYLATILDMCTRKIVGWSYSMSMTTELTIAALADACRNQGYPKHVILHSDRGSQYTSDDYLAKLKSLDFIPSFSEKGCPFDNAPIEAFHSLLKKEEVYLNRYYDFEHAKRRLFDYIEGFYNRNRIHSALGFISPVNFENLFLSC
jgi:transposase InsO family protein